MRRDISSGCIELDKREAIDVSGYYKVTRGCVALVENGERKATDFFYPGQNIYLPGDCCLVAVSDCTLQSIAPIDGLEVKIFADACRKQLRWRHMKVWEIMNEIIHDFTEHDIRDVTTLELEGFLGHTREAIGKAVNVLADAGLIEIHGTIRHRWYTTNA